MDIVGAINHNLGQAGVRTRSRIKGGVCEVQMLVPTKPKPTILSARMPVAEFAQQVGYEGDVVSGRVLKKIKSGVKAVVKNKVVKAMLKVAKPLAMVMAPGAGTALVAAAQGVKVAKKLAKKAKGGNVQAARLLKAPVKLAVVKPGAKPRGMPLVNARAAAPVKRAAPKPQPKPQSKPQPVRRVLPPMPPPPREVEQDENEPEEFADESADQQGEESADESAEQQDEEQEAQELTSSEDSESETVAGVYQVKTPAGRVMRVTLP